MLRSPCEAQYFDVRHITDFHLDDDCLEKIKPSRDFSPVERLLVTFCPNRTNIILFNALFSHTVFFERPSNGSHIGSHLFN